MYVRNLSESITEKYFPVNLLGYIASASGFYLLQSCCEDWKSEKQQDKVDNSQVSPSKFERRKIFLSLN